MNKRTISTFILLSVFIVVSALLIAYAKGVRPDFKNGKIQTTGLLVATSNPDGASVYVNDHLTTATNTTINLNPGDYRVRIIKEGYLPWQKNLKIQKEIVTKTDATLFPSTPELKPLTVNGALNPTLSPDAAKIVYAVLPQTNTNQTEQDRAGLYVLDLYDRPLSLSRSTRRIAKNTINYDFSKAKLLWSPDSKFLLALFINEQKSGPALKRNAVEILKNTEINPNDVNTAILIQADTENPSKDITPTLSIILKQWKVEQQAKYHDQLLSLPAEFQQIATTSMSLLKFSPDETKILYEATASARLPIIINPPLIGTNTQPEDRELKPKTTYVYDIKEDKNFRVDKTPRTTLLSDLIWFPDSKHFIFVENNAISTIEYDMTNKMTVYAGPFEDSYIFPWPNGSKVVILTTLNKSAGETPNLYSLGLK
jgi:hypothetical protein